jgi:histidyl-tRNA synthetase
VAGHPDKLTDITVAIDKIDKIGLEAVKEELRERGLDDGAISIIEPVLVLKGGFEEKMLCIKNILAHSETGMLGTAELNELFTLIKKAGIRQKVELDLSLARGLNYYTGAIFEVKANDFEIGSICGGGRYDNLTGIFGLPDVSGVGISFGEDRIYDVMEGLGKFPDGSAAGTRILFSNMGRNEVSYSIPVVASLRSLGFGCEIYPDEAKLKKQFDYALKKGIKFFAIVGDKEVSEGTVSIKNLDSGEQTSLVPEKIKEYIK